MRGMVPSSACFSISWKAVTKKTVLSNNSSNMEVFIKIKELLVPCLQRTSSIELTNLSSGATMAHWRRPHARRRSSGQFWRRCSPLQSVNFNTSTICGWTTLHLRMSRAWAITDPFSHWIRGLSTAGTSPSSWTMSTSMRLLCFLCCSL